MVGITTQQSNCAVLSPIESPISALQGAEASVACMIANTHTTVMARLLFTSVNVVVRESVYKEHKKDFTVENSDCKEES